MKKYESVDDYLSDQTIQARNILIKFREIMHDIYPDTEESMSYGVPTFTLYPKAKLEGKIMIAAYKNHVSVYPYPDTLEVFKEELKGYVVKKGTIQFRYQDDIPYGLVKKMILFRYNYLNKKED